MAQDPHPERRGPMSTRERTKNPDRSQAHWPQPPTRPLAPKAAKVYLELLEVVLHDDYAQAGLDFLREVARRRSRIKSVGNLEGPAFVRDIIVPLKQIRTTIGKRQQVKTFSETPPPQAHTTAQLSQATFEKLFDAWCAVQGIGEVLHEGCAGDDPTLMGLGKALQLLSHGLGDIYAEGWNSLPGNNTSRILFSA